jgi:hypothetical protein
MLHSYCSDHSVKNVVSQNGDNEKYEQLSGSLIHGMQSSDHDDWQDDSVESISLFAIAKLTTKYRKYHNIRQILCDVKNPA